MADYTVLTKGEYAQDDGLCIEMPRQGDLRWYELLLPPCPDCGGDLVWAEAGYVPGTRKCMGRPVGPGPAYEESNGCGSMFSIMTAQGGRVWLRRERFYGR